MTANRWPGRDKHAEFCILDRCKECHAFEFVHRHDQPSRGLRHGLDQQHAGHKRKAGKVSLENRVGRGDRRLGADLALGKLEVDDAVDQLEVLKTHVIRALGPLGSDEFVDAGAQILKHEILVGRGLAVVDFLRPLLEREA